MCADGGLYVANRVDPLFLLLPVLDKARGGGRFCDLEHILETAEAPALAAALPPMLQGQLECLCDAKEAGGQQYYRLSDDRVRITDTYLPSRGTLAEHLYGLLLWFALCMLCSLSSNGTSIVCEGGIII